MESHHPRRYPTSIVVRCGQVIGAFVLVLACVVTFQDLLDQRIDQGITQIEELARMPRGEYVKPAMLGYQHLGADLLWLRLLQVLGKKKNTDDEYEWIYHALDVITTLDPQYAYTYYVGGVVLTNLANRVDLSNRLLEKGLHANPGEWNLPFLLGYNHYFILGNAEKAADYIAAAARLPGGPAYLPGLATRMYTEANNPEVALHFLEGLWRQTEDPAMREVLATRAKEIIIERDITALESAVHRYQSKHGKYPRTLQDVKDDRDLVSIPQEPFGGSYKLDSRTGKVSSSTHPNRLKVFRSDNKGTV